MEIEVSSSTSTATSTDSPTSTTGKQSVRVSVSEPNSDTSEFEVFHDLADKIVNTPKQEIDAERDAKK